MKGLRRKGQCYEKLKLVSKKFTQISNKKATQNEWL